MNEEALKEAEKLKRNALNSSQNRKKNEWFNKKGLKITSLNVQGSLQSRLADLKNDKSLMVSDIICLQETGTSNTISELSGFTTISAGGGKNKGVTVYIKDGMRKDPKEPPKKFENDMCQCLKLSCGQFDIITIYLANGQPASCFEGLANLMETWITPQRPTMICGDFNFNQCEENALTKMLARKKFKQVIKKPTTYRGNCIDHFYHNIPEHVKKVEYKLHYPYYSDHEAICAMIT